MGHKQNDGEHSDRPNEPDSAGGGEQDPEHDGSDSSREQPGPREGSGSGKPDSPGGGQS